MYISHSSKIPGQPRDELQWEEEEEEEEIVDWEMKHKKEQTKQTNVQAHNFDLKGVFRTLQSIR